MSRSPLEVAGWRIPVDAVLQAVRFALPRLAAPPLLLGAECPSLGSPAPPRVWKAQYRWLARWVVEV